MKKAVRSTGPVLALALLLAGCGGETAPSATEDGKKVVSAVSGAVVAPAQGVTQGDATCIATRLVDDTGVDALVEAGVVSKTFTFTDGSLGPTQKDDEVSAVFTKARAHCLEAKVARSMAGAITTEDGLLDTDDARCTARAFTRDVGIERLVSGQVVDTSFGYVSNGALTDPANAASYASALASCLGEETVTRELSAAVEQMYATGAGGPVFGDPGCFVDGFVERVGFESLLITRLVGDTGVFSGAATSYDADTATALADALLACNDVLATEAASAAADDPGVDAAKLEACLKREVGTAYLRDKFLVKQFLGDTRGADQADRVIQAKLAGCKQQS